MVLPDGKTKHGIKGVTTPMDIAKEISTSLAKKVVVADVDGAAWDLMRPLEGDCAIKLFSFEDAEGKDVSARGVLEHVFRCMLQLSRGLRSRPTVLRASSSALRASVVRPASPWQAEHQGHLAALQRPQPAAAQLAAAPEHPYGMFSVAAAGNRPFAARSREVAAHNRRHLARGSVAAAALPLASSQTPCQRASLSNSVSQALCELGRSLRAYAACTPGLWCTGRARSPDADHSGTLSILRTLPPAGLLAQQRPPCRPGPGA